MLTAKAVADALAAGGGVREEAGTNVSFSTYLLIFHHVK
jgi:hypothetical protein